MIRGKRTVIDGQAFDSKSEAARWCELRLMEKAGQVRNIRRQVVYPLAMGNTPVLIRSERYPKGRRCKYTADFVYDELQHGEWVQVVEDHKGLHTEASRLRIAVAEVIYNFRVQYTGPQAMRSRRRPAA